jgi:hypothetical protein
VHILVDYDNVASNQTQKGPRFVADIIQSELLSKHSTLFSGDLRLDFRFYGGWQMRTGRSPRALKLISDIQRDFPAIISNRPTGSRVTLNATLAESLMALPYQTLPHTYREHSEPPKLLCKTAGSLGCLDPNCIASKVHALFQNRACPEAGCQRPIDEILSRREQKLVDTMLVADMMHLSWLREPRFAVVSSDDDLWPGMLAAMQLGTNVVHVTTKYSSTASFYLGSVRSRYSTLAL